MSASNNDIQTLYYILKKTANVKDVINSKTKDGWTAAHLAGFMNNFDSLNLLIEMGANLHEKHDHNMNVVDEIIRSDNKDLLSCVYQTYKQTQKQPQDFTPLHLAAGCGALNCLEYLLETGENPNKICSSRESSTPLHFAILANNTNAVRMLLKNKALPNQTDSLGNTPFVLAVKTKNQSIYRALEENGGNALLTNFQNINAIDLAFNEGIKDAKIFFSSLKRYQEYIRENGYSK